jgi:hypothetical protein
LRSVLPVLVLVLAAACAPEGYPEDTDTPWPDDTEAWQPDPEVESWAPRCADLVTEDSPRELFTQALLPAAHVESTVMLGNLEPEEDALNHETGFYITGSNVPLTAPADLYIGAIQRSFHPYDGVTDWGVAFDVCSYLDGNVPRAAVSGNFAHMGSLGPALQDFFDTELAKHQAGEASAMVCDEQEWECGVNLNAYRDLSGEPDFTLVIATGENLGTAGPTDGNPGPRGLDMNLSDRRINHFEGNFYLNPTRLGGEEGPPARWRYGVCPYEYFSEPHRSDLLGKVTNYDGKRESTDQPCGTLEVDRGAQGSVAGLWITSELAEQRNDPDAALHEGRDYRDSLLVLTAHVTRADTEMMLSTGLDALSAFTRPTNSLVAFAEVEAGDSQPATNVPFQQTTAGTVYCYAGSRYGGHEDATYLMEVSSDGATLQVQRLDTDCSDTAPSARTFDTEDAQYFEFKR